MGSFLLTSDVLLAVKVWYHLFLVNSNVIALTLLGTMLYLPSECLLPLRLPASQILSYWSTIIHSFMAHLSLSDLLNPNDSRPSTPPPLELVNIRQEWDEITRLSASSPYLLVSPRTQQGITRVLERLRAVHGAASPSSADGLVSLPRTPASSPSTRSLATSSVAPDSLSPLPAV